MDDDLDDREEFTDDALCEKCGAVNIVEGLSGPKHGGGWEDSIDLNCRECGAGLAPVKAFRASVTGIRKK